MRLQPHVLTFEIHAGTAGPLKPGGFLRVGVGDYISLVSLIVTIAVLGAGLVGGWAVINSKIQAFSDAFKAMAETESEQNKTLQALTTQLATLTDWRDRVDRRLNDHDKAFELIAEMRADIAALRAQFAPVVQVIDRALSRK